MNWVIYSGVDETRVCHTDEISQKEKNKNHILTYIWNLE